MKSSFNIKHHWNKILKGSSDGQWSQVSILNVIETKFWSILAMGNKGVFNQLSQPSNFFAPRSGKFFGYDQKGVRGSN